MKSLLLFCLLVVAACAEPQQEQLNYGEIPPGIDGKTFYHVKADGFYEEILVSLPEVYHGEVGCFDVELSIVPLVNVAVLPGGKSIVVNGFTYHYAEKPPPLPEICNRAL